jgi:hypothetical protein
MRALIARLRLGRTLSLLSLLALVSLLSIALHKGLPGRALAQEAIIGAHVYGDMGVPVPLTPCALNLGFTGSDATGCQLYAVSAFR